MLSKTVSRALALGVVAALAVSSALKAFEPGVRLAWDFRSAEPITSGVYARMIPRLDGDRWLLVYSDGPHVYARDSAPGGGPPFSAARHVATLAGYNSTNAEVARLANGWLILGYNARPLSAGSLPYQIRTLLSRDDGETWTDERVAYTAGTSAGVGCWEPAFLQLPSGELLLFFANEAPYAATSEQEIGLLRSYDHGLSWQDYGAASFRAGSRDGMPVPLLLADGVTAVFSIEDNGLSGRFKPAIVASSIADAWRSAPVGGGSAQRWAALRSDFTLPPAVYAGAPYLARLRSGELALSVQSTEGRAGTDHTYSAPRVYLGNAAARDFARPSTPLPWLPVTAAANWNSLAALSEDRVALLSSFRGVPSALGAETIWQIQARVLAPIDLPYRTVAVDGIADPGEWEGWAAGASPVYLGGYSRSDLNAFAQWDEQHLYLLLSVRDAQLWLDSANTSTWDDDGVEVCIDLANTNAAALAAGLHRIVVAPTGEIAFSQTTAAGSWSPLPAGSIGAKHTLEGTLNHNADTDTGYTIELAIPWSALGGRPATDAGWGLHVRLHHDDNGGVAEWHEDLGGNDPARPATWTGATLRDGRVAPRITAQPLSQKIPPGGRASFSVSASGTEPLAYQWLKDNVPIAGATAATWVLPEAQIADGGDYSVTVSNSIGAAVSESARLSFDIVLNGSALEVGSDIRHPNGNVFDQVLLTGTTATVRADPGQITRVSFIDLNDDIVQLEFSGAGQVNVTLENASGPALPAKYHQAVTYMKGHAAIEVSGADRTTHLGLTSVGKLTAYDPTGAYDVALAASPANDPLRNGNPIFRANENYDGIADLAVVTIRSPAGAFGGLYSGGAGFYRTQGKTGIDAPGVEFTGAVVIHDITASGSAAPVLITGPVGSGLDEASGLRGIVRIAGGDLSQPNAAPVEIDGLRRLRPVANVTSHYAGLPASPLLARIVRQHVDVTDDVVERP